MISKIYKLPSQDKPSAEIIKIENLFSTYPDDSQLFIQNETEGLIFFLDSDAIIYGNINADEVKKFLGFLKPKSVFSSSDNLTKLSLSFDEVNVLMDETPRINGGNDTFCYTPSSREAFDLLSVDEFILPEYEFFATDYCRRLNHGRIRVFAKPQKCIAITLEGEKYRMIGGIASRQKGLGGALLLAAVSGNKPVLAVCRDELLPFYSKFGFKPLYKAGYWRK